MKMFRNSCRSPQGLWQSQFQVLHDNKDAFDSQRVSASTSPGVAALSPASTGRAPLGSEKLLHPLISKAHRNE